MGKEARLAKQIGDLEHEFYIHKKSGTKYKLIGFCTNENTSETMAIYQNYEHCQLWCRPAGQFHEKFEPVD